MKKSWIAKLLAIVFALTCAIGCFAGCGDSATTIKFYTWGNETEQQVMRDLVARFNRENTDMKVNLTLITSGDYETKLTNALRGRNVPDVFIAGDGEIKKWISMGAVEKLDEYLTADSVIDLEDMYTEGVNRYRFDSNSPLAGRGDLYGIMRDYSPSCIYYNIDAFEAVGITCISMKAADAITQYGDGSAYFTHEGKKYFNNQVPMDWEELLELAIMMTSNESAPERNDISITKYGMYVINWFCFGFSVGGNCLKWVEDDRYVEGGYYDFSLFDSAKNYIVNEGKSVTVNGTTYNAGEIVEYGDRAALTADDKANCTELPSQLDAMQYFVDLSVKHKVSPVPDVTASNSSYSIFSSGQAAMLIDTRYATGIFRKTIDGSREPFKWDVAPIPQHKDGILAGHSGSEAYCIAKNSRKKDLAWRFIEYMSTVGGEAFAKEGFTVPANKQLAQSDIFMQSNQNPKNSQIFLDATEYQTVGDWGYLPSKAWINIWANPLNTDVLNGDMTLAELEALTKNDTQAAVLDFFHLKAN